MADATVQDLLQRSGISFVGTVLQLGAATLDDIQVDDHTAVFTVDLVLQAPPAFSGLAGSRVTVQLAAGDPPAVGSQVAIFANAIAYGQTLAVAEVGRVPVAEIAPHLGITAAATGERPIADLTASVAASQLSQHAAGADAVVVGTVSRLEQAGQPGFGEHDPSWWLATLDVQHVEHGDVPGPTVTVAYANSLDVHWRDSPKPRAGQSGVWLLHRTEGPVADVAPYYLPDAVDYQPVQALDVIRGTS